MMTRETHKNRTPQASDPSRNPRPHRQTALAKPGRLPECRKKLSTDRQFVEQLLTDQPTSRATIVLRVEEMRFFSATVDRYLRRLSNVGLIACEYGFCWRK